MVYFEIEAYEWPHDLWWYGHGTPGSQVNAIQAFVRVRWKGARREPDPREFIVRGLVRVLNWFMDSIHFWGGSIDGW
jgi:hypothetical protein